MARVAPSERFRHELDEVLEGVDREADPIEAVGRLGARVILQQALEDEVTEFLGRLHYARTADPIAHRNGYDPADASPARPRAVAYLGGPRAVEPRLAGRRHDAEDGG